MKKHWVVGGLVAVVLALWWNRLCCFLRGQHTPVRQPVGGWRCSECGRPGADLGEMGMDSTGYVDTLTRTWDRGEGAVERRLWEEVDRLG